MIAMVKLDREGFRRLFLRFKITVTLLAVAAAAASLGMVALRLSPKASAAEGEGIKLPVLMYHAIMSDPNRMGEYVITPQAFRRDLEYISQAGYETVVLEDIIAHVRSGAPLPEKPIMITFDDGYYNNYLHAFPMLREYGMKAVISVIGTETDKYSVCGEVNENYSHCTWDMLRQMHESGIIELQNHSYDMHHIHSGYMGIGKKSGEEIAAYRTRLYMDLSRMQDRFYEELGTSPTAFTFPFGCAPADSRPVLDELGFIASMGSEERTYVVTDSSDCLHLIPRYNRPSWRSAREILEEA